MMLTLWFKINYITLILWFLIDNIDYRTTYFTDSALSILLVCEGARL